MKRIRTVAMLPTLFTLGNLVCGFFALAVISRIDAPTPDITRPDAVAPVDKFIGFDPTDDTHNIMLTATLIFLAMIFDALDGHVARLAKHTTDFGAQLDSLCDLVTFGVAPGFLLVKMSTSFTISHRYGIWIIAAAFAACAVLRLARFNVETEDDDDHMWFSGLPVPAAAATIAGFALLLYSLRTMSNPTWHTQADEWVQRLLPFLSMLLSLLMVSRIPYPHVVNQLLRGNRSFAHVVMVIFALVLVMLRPTYAVPLLASSFAILPPGWFLWQRYYLRQNKEEPIF